MISFFGVLRCTDASANGGGGRAAVRGRLLRALVKQDSGAL